MPDLSLREQIEQAMNLKPEAAVTEVEEKEEAKVEEVVEEVAETEEVEEETEETEEEETVEAKPEPVVDIPAPPQSLKGELKAKWKDLPPEVRSEFVRLEHTQAKGMQKIAEDANFGKALKSIVQPYEAMIRAEGSSPEKAVQSLLNTAYLLRSSSPAQKQQLFANLARQYGVDVKGLSQDQPQIDPNVAQLQQRLNSIEQERMYHQHAQQQAQEKLLMESVESFLSDPKNEYAEIVTAKMLKTLDAFQQGEEMTKGAILERLQTAYDESCWAVPEIRQQILTKQRAQEEAARKEQARAKVESKKTAGSSLKGSSGKSTAGKLSADMPLRDLIAAQVYGDGQRL